MNTPESRFFAEFRRHQMELTQIPCYLTVLEEINEKLRLRERELWDMILNWNENCQTATDGTRIVGERERQIAN
jgi:hypothetical protein